MLHIDQRERLLVPHMDAIPIEHIPCSIHWETLDIGDMTWTHELVDGSLSILVERKTFADLSASICDGRYRDQKSRLLQWRAADPERRIVLYLIEGVPTTWRLDIHTWYGFQTHVQTADHIPILHSRNEIDTWMILFYLWKDTLEHSSKYGGGGGSSPSDILSTTYQKSRIADQSICFHRQLCVIPGVSDMVATGIVERFCNWSELISFPREDLVNEIAEIRYGTSQRRIGVKLSEKIVALI
jgi:ERCC4-type nuclease